MVGPQTRQCASKVARFFADQAGAHAIADLLDNVFDTQTVATALDDAGAAPTDRVMSIDASGTKFWSGHGGVVLVNDPLATIEQVIRAYDIRWLVLDRDDSVASVAPILDGKADAVFGSRFAAGSQRKVLLYWHSVANKLLTLATNILNDINITDMETCFKVVRAELLKSLPLRSDRFGIEPEITAKLFKRGARVYEVPITYEGRDYAEGKKISWRDGVPAPQ